MSKIIFPIKTYCFECGNELVVRGDIVIAKIFLDELGKPDWSMLTEAYPDYDDLPYGIVNKQTGCPECDIWTDPIIKFDFERKE